MANNLAGRVWELDTAGAGVIYQDWFRCVTIYWRAPGTIGDVLVLEDVNGNPIWDARCEVADQSQVLRVANMWYHGLVMPTQDSGLVQIHIM